MILIPGQYVLNAGKTVNLRVILEGFNNAVKVCIPHQSSVSDTSIKFVSGWTKMFAIGN